MVDRDRKDIMVILENLTDLSRIVGAAKKGGLTHSEILDMMTADIMRIKRNLLETSQSVASSHQKLESLNQKLAAAVTRLNIKYDEIYEAVQHTDAVVARNEGRLLDLNDRVRHAEEACRDYAEEACNGLRDEVYERLAYAGDATRNNLNAINNRLTAMENMLQLPPAPPPPPANPPFQPFAGAPNRLEQRRRQRKSLA